MNEKLLTLWIAQIVVCIPLMILHFIGIISNEVFWVVILLVLFVSIITPTKK